MSSTLLRVDVGFGRVQDVFSPLCVRVRLLSLVHPMADSLTKKEPSTRCYVMSTTCSEGCALSRCHSSALSAHMCRVLRNLAKI